MTYRVVVNTMRRSVTKLVCPLCGSTVRLEGPGAVDLKALSPARRAALARALCACYASTLPARLLRDLLGVAWALH